MAATVRSPYCSREHIRVVGDAKYSKRFDEIAFDIAMTNHDPEAFEAAARASGFKDFGFDLRSRFIHIDVELAPSWGERFPEAGIGVRRRAAAASPPSVPPESRPAASGPALTVMLSECAVTRDRARTCRAR